MWETCVPQDTFGEGQSSTRSSFSTRWVLEVVLKSLGLVASTLTPWAISLIQIVDFCLLGGSNPVLLYYKVYFNIFYSYIFCAYACVWRPEYNLQLSILSFHHVRPRHWTHVIRLSPWPAVEGHKRNDMKESNDSIFGGSLFHNALSFFFYHTGPLCQVPCHLAGCHFKMACGYCWFYFSITSVW